jgi:hypothetical protein
VISEHRGGLVKFNRVRRVSDEQSDECRSLATGLPGVRRSAVRGCDPACLAA